MKKEQTAVEFKYSRGSCFVLNLVAAVMLIGGLIQVAHAAPEDGVVRAGSAKIVEQGSTTLIQQSSQRAVIDWRGFSINSNEQVRFAQPSAGSATLNRVTGNQVSMILGRMDANGHVLLINPNGIIFGNGAQINVGSLIASTANLSNDNFMQGKLVFDHPGQPGAGIINAGSITAAEGGLVALVAPHVRNDGLIQARLGKVIMGSADTFTIDLYGDGLIKLALSDDSLAQLKDPGGEPVKSLISQSGVIDVGSGQAVLVTAEAAKGMLDSLINMSGVILAESAVQEGGRILLLARGGNVDVSGELNAGGTKGGQIEVLGDQVHLASSAKLDADGTYGGGTLHIGGDYQGSSETYRSVNTEIDNGAILSAGALTSGDGGEVVVWSDGRTSYAGSIQARGGMEGGNGGLVEVSGKQMLDFNGLVDAGANYGNAGSLLIDPYNFTIGMTEASLINRVLRTGTSTSVSADNDIYVNYLIDGRGRYAGGGLTLSSGNNIQVNDHIVTNNGAINLYAGRGAVSLAPGKVVYAGTAPITVRSGADLYNAPYLTGGLLSLISTLGSVYINQGIDSSTGNLFLQAAGDVNVNEPIVSLNDGNSVTISSGNDINVDAQIDGRPAFGNNPNGTVTMTAGRNIDLNKSILANTINLTANLGTINAPTMKAGTVTIDDTTGIPAGVGLFSGTGPISVTSGGNLFSGIYVTTGPVSIRSTGGDVNVDTKLVEILGNVTIKSDTGSVNVDQEIANIRSGSDLTITAGADINLNRQIDALDDSNPLSITPIPGGRVTFVAGNNVNLNKDLVTYNGPVNITATAGKLNIAWKDILNDPDKRTYRIQTGSAPITVTTGGNLSTGTAPPTSYIDFPVLWNTVKQNYWVDLWINGINWGDYRYADYVVDQLKLYVAFSTTGKLSLTSTGGNVTVDAPIPNTTGEVAITAASSVTYDDKGRAVIAGDKGIIVNHKILSNNQPIILTAGSGGITVNSTNDNYGILSYSVQRPAIDPRSGPLTLQAASDISIVTSNGIATSNILTIDTRGKILQGAVNEDVGYRPSKILLNADKGINSFYAGSSPIIDATSSNGAINLTVFGPGKLTINAPSSDFGNVSVYAVFGQMGDDVKITAGRDIGLSDVLQGGGTLHLTAGRDANLNTLMLSSLYVKASSIYFNRTESFPTATIWLNGDLTAIATGMVANPDRLSTTGDILFKNYMNYSAVHIGGGKSLTLDADKSVELGFLESRGPVSITAQTGDITLRNDIGPPIRFYMGGNFYKYVYIANNIYNFTNDLSEIPSNVPYFSSFDPNGDGVASLYLKAVQGNIFMQGAKAAGPVTITAGGMLTPTKGIYSGTENGLIINATGGALEKLSSGDFNHPGPYTFNGTSFGNITLDPQEHLESPGFASPVGSPGPAVAPPGLPGALTALPALPPDLVNVSGIGIPAASGADEEITEIEIEPVQVAGSGSLSEIIPDEYENTDDEENLKKILKFAGGRGIAQTTDFGRR